MKLKELFNFIDIKNVGWLEMIIALYPILAGYGYGSFKLSFGMLLILDVLLICRANRKMLHFGAINTLFIYMMLHHAVWLFVVPSIQSYFINSIIADFIFLLSLLIIVPYLDYIKLKNSINIVAIVCIGGMFYHLMMLNTGHSISPIKLPLLPEMGSQSRLYAVMERPTSFFWEPQSYASFMLVPLFFALREKRMIWSFLIAASMILSTSTTGILLSVIMIAFYTTTQKQKLIYRIISIGLVIGLVYFLVTSQFASAGLEKLESTNFEESNRTINGLLIAQSLSFSDLMFGIPYSNFQEAYDLHAITNSVIVKADGKLFVSAFWVSLISYGLVGLLIFLSVYYKIYKINGKILPYLVCIFIALFSNPDYIGASYVFQIIIMLTFVYYHKNEENIYSNNAVC